jgi:hypothetical protein
VGLLERIARDAGVPELVDVLAEKLSPTDLQSLLLEVAKRRAAARTPADLVRQYKEDRFVRPSKADPRMLLAIARHAFASVPARYAPVELAPIAPLGTCAVVAAVAQHKIVSTMRTGEVVSDATNLLALECAVRRAADRTTDATLCASARMTRAQALPRPDFFAHFQLFVTIAMGRDPGGRTFEQRALVEQVGAQLALLTALARDGFDCARRELTLSPDATHLPVAERARDELLAVSPDLPIAIDPARIAASGYYRGLAFRLDVRSANGTLFPLGDGGLTDWGAKLTGSRKERTLVGAIGTELLATALAPRP